MGLHLAIVGATGAVGQELCSLITERTFCFERLSLFASSRSEGRHVRVGGQDFAVEKLGKDSFNQVDMAVFCASATVSREWVPVAVSAGTTVVDNSSALRMQSHVPLVIPEVNPGDVKTHSGVIANPNCSTIIMNVVVWQLHKVCPINRIVVSTYQAASGAGAAAMEELRQQTAAHLRGEKLAPVAFPYPIAFNLFSHDSPDCGDGYNMEENKMIEETRKIFHEPDLSITATCIRVPVLRAHSESINLTFERPMAAEAVREILENAEGVKVVDDADSGYGPMPVEASGRDSVLVGRIRDDRSQPDGRGVELFVCGDQLRKGAALNALQICELLVGSGAG